MESKHSAQNVIHYFQNAVKPDDHGAFKTEKKKRIMDHNLKKLELENKEWYINPIS